MYVKRRLSISGFGSRPSSAKASPTLLAQAAKSRNAGRRYSCLPAVSEDSELAAEKSKQPKDIDVVLAPPTRSAPKGRRWSMVQTSSDNGPKATMLDDLRAAYTAQANPTKKNPQNVTDSALLKRESLKFSPVLTKAIMKVWDAVDENNVGRISQTRYTEFSNKLYRAINEEWDSDEAEKFSKENWELDGHMDGSIDLEHFRNALFRIAEDLTEGFAHDEYLAFMRALYHNITDFDDELEKRILKEIEDIDCGCGLVFRMEGKAMTRSAVHQRLRHRLPRSGGIVRNGGSRQIISGRRKSISQSAALAMALQMAQAA